MMASPVPARTLSYAVEQTDFHAVLSALSEIATDYAFTCSFTNTPQGCAWLKAQKSLETVVDQLAEGRERLEVRKLSSCRDAR